MTLLGSRNSSLQRYGVAIGVVLLAAGLRALVTPWLASRLVYITFFPAVAIAAVVGGIGPGLLALGLSAVAAIIWLGSPRTLWTNDPVALAGLFIFLIAGLVIVMVSGALKRSREQTAVALELQQQAAADAASSEHRFRELAREREELLASERAARSEAERTSRMKDEFLATLSHELRTPLNAILGWAHLLRRNDGSCQSPEQFQHGIAIIERSARVQTQLIEDLLDMSRIISGKLRLEIRQVNLPAVIDSAIESVRHSADAKELLIERTIDPQTPPIRGDSARLQQVVWNLLSNAIKFTQRGGRVTVSVWREESLVQIEVRDTGNGIDPAFLPHLFERFRQADASTTRKHAGLGLGLAIVKHLVELHGGTVQASSDGPGKGASFRLSFPIPPAQPPEQESTPQSVDAKSSSEDNDANDFADIRIDDVSVLVVDDEPDARELIRHMLEESGASVASADSARSAIDLLKDKEFDVLVSDIGMPMMDGYSLISELRRSSRVQQRNMPAVALTAFARSEDRRRAMLAGFDMFVTKPVEPVELLAVVARLGKRG